MGALTGKTALVTGGGRGIGRAISERLAADGALVAVHYGSDEAAAKDTVATIGRAGGSAFELRAELGVPGDAETLWTAFDARIGEHAGGPGLDILVNNAGITAYGRIHEVTEEGYDRVFAINARAPFFILQHGLRRLRDGGRVINISTGATRISFPMATAYSMTKGALEVLTHTLALDLGPRGITVNSVAPGVVDTSINPWLADPAERRRAEAYSTFDRIGQPSDIADVVAFVASDDARWVTGQNIDATGGSLLGV